MYITAAGELKIDSECVISFEVQKRYNLKERFIREAIDPNIVIDSVNSQLNIKVPKSILSKSLKQLLSLDEYPINYLIDLYDPSRLLLYNKFKDEFFNENT